MAKPHVVAALKDKRAVAVRQHRRIHHVALPVPDAEAVHLITLAHQPILISK